MPPGTVKVDRSTPWGNPFNFKASECCWLALSFGCRGDAAGRQEASVLAFRDWITPSADGRRLISDERQVVLKAGRRKVPVGPKVCVGAPPPLEDIRRELGGLNLACWCRPGTSCYADVLLELANG